MCAESLAPLALVRTCCRQPREIELTNPLPSHEGNGGPREVGRPTSLSGELVTRAALGAEPKSPVGGRGGQLDPKSALAACACVNVSASASS